MQKIIINACHGGYGVSEKAMRLYAEKKGISCFVEVDDLFNTYWLVPEDERPAPLEGSDWHNATMDERKAWNVEYRSKTLNERDNDRSDPIMVKVIEELGKAADNRFSELKIVEIPDNVEWQIEEYDGLEWVAEKHRTWS